MNRLSLLLSFCSIFSFSLQGFAQQNKVTSYKQKDASIDSLLEKHSTLLSKEELLTGESLKINTKAVYEKPNYGKLMQVIKEDKNPTSKK